ncbi:MAG: cytochrome c3 family protein [bacterium]|nr:cytochrome c3 family protein [bacterium]
MESREEKVAVRLMEKEGWRQLSHGLILLAGIFLLVVSRTFLVNKPFLGSGLLLLFSLLSFAFARLVARIFMYPAAFLLILSCFLAALGLGASFTLVMPILSIPLILMLSGISLGLMKLKAFTQEALQPLDRCASLVSFFFIAVMLIQSKEYLEKQPAIAAITLGFYSIFYYWQLIRRPAENSPARAAIWSYLTLICLPLTLIFLLYQIPAIPKQAYGLCLIALFMIFMYAGIWQKQGQGEKRLWYPTSVVVGFIGLVLALCSYWSNLTLFMLVQFLYSFHFLRLHTLLQNSRLAKATAGQVKQHKQTVFLLLSYLCTLGYLSLFAWQGFPVSFFYLGIALAYALLYFTAAWQTNYKTERERSIPTYLFGLFMNIAFFEGLLIHSPVYEISWYLILTIPLIWLFFWLGYLGQQMKRPAFSKSIYEIQFLTVLIAFLIPLQLSSYSLDFICMLGFGYLFSMLIFFLFTEDQKFLYPTVLVMAFVYYYLIPKDAASFGGGNLLFLLPGFLLLGIGMRSQQKNYPLAELWYFSWLILSGFFLVTLDYSSAYSPLGLSICVFLHYLVFSYARRFFPRLSGVSYWAGSLLSLIAILAWLYSRNLPSGIFLGCILFTAHLFMAYQTKKSWHIYTSCFILAVVWHQGLLAKMIVPAADMLPTWALPVALLFYGCSLWAKPFLPWGRNAFKIAGHLWVATIILLTLINPQAGGRAGYYWLFLAFLVYTVGYLALTWIFPCYEHFFLASAFLSMSYYFGLRQVSGLLPAMRLQYFFFAPFFLGLAGYFIKRRWGQEQAQPVFDVATLVALTCSTMALFYGDFQICQKLLLLSAILYMFLAVQLAKELYLYLTTITLGLLAYNFLTLNHQKCVSDLSAYSLYLISFLGIFLFLSPISNHRLQADSATGSRETPRQPKIQWKKTLAYLGLLASFPGILIPLYSQKIINYPGFCSQCHYMRPYTEAWQTSSHQKVSCVTCHYEHLNTPSENLQSGEEAGKFELTLRTLLRTYSIFPQSRVSNQACLQPGCHRWEELQEEKQFKHGIRFSHEQHLKTLPRGKRLGCISCHSQIVQGKHVRVTETICFNCHFKGRQEKDTGVGRCITCHSLPGISISFAGVELNHQQFLANNENIQCTDCHIKVTQGDGQVPRERCFTCHININPQAKLTQDPPLLHTIHVNQQSIECFRCHQDIQHGQENASQQASINCMACHRNDHSLPKRISSGPSEGVLMDEMTRPMMAAKKSCQGCHP